jgi:hypothetical protein
MFLAGRIRFSEGLLPGASVRMGERIASITA